MVVNSKYRLVGKASWTIAINISAEWSVLTGPPSEATQLGDWLWFGCAERTVPVEDMHYFMLGLKVVSEDIDKRRKGAARSSSERWTSITTRPTTRRKG